MIIEIKKFFIVTLIVALPMLVSCDHTPEKPMPTANKNEGKVVLECVVPFDDVKKTIAFKNFQKDVVSIAPDYDIHLRFVKGDMNAYDTKIKVMMYSDPPPDIFYSGDESFTYELYSSKRILPLEDELNDIDFWNMVMPAAKVIEDTEHIYAVPIDEAYYNIMLINTELFAANDVNVPENFKELKNAINQFKAKSIIPIALGAKDGLSVYNMIESFANTLDPEITSKIISGHDTFTEGSFRQAALAVKQLIELGAFQEKVETISDEEAENFFYSKQAAIYCTSSAKLTMAKHKLDEKVAAAYYPILGETQGTSLKKVVTGGTKQDLGLLISSSTNFPAEAVEVAVEMSKYYNKVLYETEGDAATIYNLDQMNWTPSKVPDELMMNVKQDGRVSSGLFQYNFSPDMKKSIKEASTAFMTGLLSVDDYLKEMDSMKIKR